MDSRSKRVKERQKYRYTLCHVGYSDFDAGMTSALSAKSASSQPLLGCFSSMDGSKGGVGSDGKNLAQMLLTFALTGNKNLAVWKFTG